MPSEDRPEERRWNFDAARAGTARDKIARAAADFRQALFLSWSWSLLAAHDIRRRHQGSYIGGFWITLQTALMVTAIGLIFGRVLGIADRDYIPYLTLSWILWQFISAIIAESPRVFLDPTILTMAPQLFFVHIFRLVFRNVFVLCFNLPVIVAVFVFYQVEVKPSAILAVAGIGLLIVNALWVSTLLGVLGARYRDVQQFVGIMLQLLFFLTPVLWSAHALGSWSFLVDTNPVNLVMESIRGPLLHTGKGPPPWFWLGLLQVAGSFLAFWLFAQARSRIPYWV